MWLIPLKRGPLSAARRTLGVQGNQPRCPSDQGLFFWIGLGSVPHPDTSTAPAERLRRVLGDTRHQDARMGQFRRLPPLDGWREAC
jgi:hypothetical protein